MTSPTVTTHTQTFQLAYGDCDAVGIVYFAIYYPWMERTYSSWLWTQGLASHTMPDDIGVYVVGFSSECRYVRTAEVFDVLTCTAGLVALGDSTYAISFDFTRDGERVAVGRIRYACRSLEHTKATVPQRLRDALSTLPPGVEE